MADNAENYGVRAYSFDSGNEVRILCEEHAPEHQSADPEDYAILIEEYKWEDTFRFVAEYTCDVCGREQYERRG
jgi:hypothetical protein